MPIAAVITIAVSTATAGHRASAVSVGAVIAIGVGAATIAGGVAKARSTAHPTSRRTRMQSPGDVAGSSPRRGFGAAPAVRGGFGDAPAIERGRRATAHGESSDQARVMVLVHCRQQFKGLSGSRSPRQGSERSPMRRMILLGGRLPWRAIGVGTLTAPCMPRPVGLRLPLGRS